RIKRKNRGCQSTNTDVVSAETSLSIWFFPQRPTRRARLVKAGNLNNCSPSSARRRSTQSVRTCAKSTGKGKNSNTTKRRGSNGSETKTERFLTDSGNVVEYFS